MKKKLFLFLSICASSTFAQVGNCDNAGFESSNGVLTGAGVTGWSFRSGTFGNTAATKCDEVFPINMTANGALNEGGTNATDAPANVTWNRHTVMTTASGSDANSLNNVPCVAPANLFPSGVNKYSFRIGNAVGTQIGNDLAFSESAKFTFLVTKQNAGLTYLYSAFLNEGGASKHSDENEELDNTSNLSTMHKKKSKSTINTVYAQSTIPSDYDSPSKLSFKTNSKYDDNDDKERRRSTTSTTNTTQSWTWQTPGLFSERGSTNFLRFRQKMYYSMRAPQLVKRLQQSMPSFTGWESGRQSGMFWYPPGGVREWHTNRYDLGHEITKLSPRDREVMKSQVWRMYFVRTVREDTFDTKLEKLKKRSSDSSNNDHSGMHIIPGEDAGLSLEVLRRAGARPLTTDEKERQWSDEFAEDYVVPSSSDGNNGTIASNDDDGKNSNNFDRNTVWRVPDHDGYVTLFRLPNIWHCIISEEVHRFSLGFAFSEKEVQALLTMAGVDFDVAMEQPLGHDENHRMDENDEL